MKTSIIVVHKMDDPGTAYLSTQCLRRLVKSGSQIVSVDNNSSESDAVAEVRSISDIYIRNKENVGNTIAWDQGIDASDGDIVIVMDNDCWPLVDSWHKAMVDKLVPSVGVVFPYSIVGDEELFKYENNMSVDFRGRRDGFCMMFRKEIYRKAGPFMQDQPFKLGYYEDDNFCAEVQFNLGLKLTSAPGAKVWHKGQGTTKKMWSEEIEEGIIQNKKWFEDKWKGQTHYLT